MKRETPATTGISRTTGNATQTVYACARHVQETIRRLGSRDLTVERADPAVHGCKGCLDGWEP